MSLKTNQEAPAGIRWNTCANFRGRVSPSGWDTRVARSDNALCQTQNVQRTGGCHARR